MHCNHHGLEFRSFGMKLNNHHVLIILFHRIIKIYNEFAIDLFTKFKFFRER